MLGHHQDSRVTILQHGESIEAELLVSFFSSFPFCLKSCIKVCIHYFLCQSFVIFQVIYATYFFPLQENSKRFDRSIVIRCRIIDSSCSVHDVFIWNGRYLLSWLFMGLICRLYNIILHFLRLMINPSYTDIGFIYFGYSF